MRGTRDLVTVRLADTSSFCRAHCQHVAAERSTNGNINHALRTLRYVSKAESAQEKQRKDDDLRDVVGRTKTTPLPPQRSMLSSVSRAWGDPDGNNYLGLQLLGAGILDPKSLPSDPLQMLELDLTFKSTFGAR
jgi:hypothetical protein